VLAVLGPAPDAAQRREVEESPGCSLLETGLMLDWTIASRAELERLTAALIDVARDVGAHSAHLHAPALAATAWPIPVAAVAHSCMATWHDAVHGGTQPESIAWHAAATASGLRVADAVIAPSAAFARALAQVHAITRLMLVVHNGLPCPAAQDIRRDPFVFAAGRLWDTAKNMTVLDAAAELMRFPVRVAGPCSAPGGQAVAFRHLQVMGNLSSTDARATMASSSIFASPALYEPFGLAVLEAAQRATPLVLADIPTFRELWQDAAVFVSPHDAQAWAATLDSLMQDEDRRAALGQAGRHRAGLYTQDAMSAATAAIHRSLWPRARRAA
jgi:glycosyltransferase involved in cell wall biosynthesis